MRRCSAGCYTNQWLNLTIRNQLKFFDKLVEMLIAGVNMGLCANLGQLIKVMVVHVDKNTEESSEDLLHSAHKCLGEGNF